MLVFISHSSKDNDFVHSICKYLNDLNIDCWLDDHHLKPAQDWHEEVREVMPKVDTVLFFMSKASQDSENVQWELQQAKLNNKKILTLKITPDPITLEGLEHVIYIDLFTQDSLLDNLNKLAEALRTPSHTTAHNHTARIFINYRQGSDVADQELAEFLNEELCKYGATVWLDIAELGHGDQWGQAIKQGIDSCDWLLQIVSASSLNSRRVDAIWREFINQGKEKNIILILNSRIAVNYKLRNCAYADFTEDRLIGWGQLLTILDKQKMPLNPPVRAEDKLPQPTAPLNWHKDRGTLYLISPQTLQPRAKFSKPDSMIQKARHEIWVSGVSLTKIVDSDFYPFLKLSQEPPNRIRFLLVDPLEDPCVEESNDYLGIDDDKDELRSNINYSLRHLSKLKRSPDVTQQVKIRVMKHRPANGYFIVDPDGDDTGMMTVSPYLYHIDKLAPGKFKKDREPPFIFITRLGERQTFEMFCEDFREMWEDAREWPDGKYPVRRS